MAKSVGRFKNLDLAIRQVVEIPDSYIKFKEEIVWNYGDKPFEVYIGDTLVDSYTNSDEAIISAMESLESSRVELDGVTIWKNGDEAYKLFRIYKDIGTFVNIDGAISEGVKWVASKIEFLGQIIWKYGDRVYKLRDSTGKVIDTYPTIMSAIKEGLTKSNSTITRFGQTMWEQYQAVYRVYQHKAFLGEFIDLDQAIIEAKKWNNSRIEIGGVIIWVYDDILYKVYQNASLLGKFLKFEDAIDEALKWNNSRIEFEGNIVWTYDEILFKVYQGTYNLKNFRLLNDAIKEAMKWKDSRIEQNGVIVWHYATSIYKVSQNGVQIGIYPNLDDAIKMATKFKDSTIELNGQTVWKYGDHIKDIPDDWMLKLGIAGLEIMQKEKVINSKDYWQTKVADEVVQWGFYALACGATDRLTYTHPTDNTPPSVIPPVTAPETPRVADAIINKLKTYLGTPYVWGGAKPGGFDCSGIIYYVYPQFGINVPRTARQQQNYARPITGNEAKAGDLVFWGRPAYHVGILLGNGKYLHAPQTGDVVKISTLKGWTSLGRVIPENNYN